MQIPAIPEGRDMLSHSISSSGTRPTRHFSITFTYPDCTRTFDGQHWTVTPFPVVLPG